MERKVRVFINHRFVGEIKIKVDGYNLKIPILRKIDITVKDAPTGFDKPPEDIDIPLYRDMRDGAWFISIDSKTYLKARHFFEKFTLDKGLLFYALTASKGGEAP